MGTAARPERAGGILVAAGSSSRMGFDKLWALLGDQPVLRYGLSTLAEADLDEVVVVVAADRQAEARALVARMALPFQVCVGGARRRDSVAAGLVRLERCDWAVVHDAARPLASVDLVRRGLEAARMTGAAVPGLPLADTVKRVRDGVVAETLRRDELRRVQTPQIFARSMLARALESSDEDVGDEATLVERLGHEVRVFPGEEWNFKLTRPEDLRLAEAILGLREAGPDASLRSGVHQAG